MIATAALPWPDADAGPPRPVTRVEITRPVSGRFEVRVCERSSADDAIAVHLLYGTTRAEVARRLERAWLTLELAPSRFFAGGAVAYEHVGDFALVAEVVALLGLRFVPPGR